GPIDNTDGGITQGGVRAFQRNNQPALPINGQWSDAAMQGLLDATVTQYINGDGAVYVSGFGPSVGPLTFAFVRSQFQAMYCEMESEPRTTPAAPAPALTAAQGRDAMLWARQQAHAKQNSYGLTTRRNVNAISLDNFETPPLFVICAPRQYNR